jgi:hypothetical protein
VSQDILVLSSFPQWFKNIKNILRFQAVQKKKKKKKKKVGNRSDLANQWL